MEYTYIYHKSQTNVDNCTSHMDPLGSQITFTCFIMRWQPSIVKRWVAPGDNRAPLGVPRPLVASEWLLLAVTRKSHEKSTIETIWTCFGILNKLKKNIATVLKVFWLIEGFAFQVPTNKQTKSVPVFTGCFFEHPFIQ